MIPDAEKPIAQRCRAHKVKDAWLNDQQPSKGYTFKGDLDRQSEAEFMRDSVWAWGLTSN
jgi:hypothetical protein